MFCIMEKKANLPKLAYVPTNIFICLKCSFKFFRSLRLPCSLKLTIEEKTELSRISVLKGVKYPLESWWKVTYCTL